jgi:hypothetical protein
LALYIVPIYNGSGKEEVLLFQFFNVLIGIISFFLAVGIRKMDSAKKILMYCEEKEVE